jgi:hypothetical protein
LGEGALPAQREGRWRIELRDHPITPHRSHAVLALIGPDGERAVAELNGLSNSRNFSKDREGNDRFLDSLSMGIDGSKLIAHSSGKQTGMGENSSRVASVAEGSYDDIVRGIWQRGISAADQINRRNFDYKAHDPAYEFGG